MRRFGAFCLIPLFWFLYECLSQRAAFPGLIKHDLMPAAELDEFAAAQLFNFSISETAARLAIVFSVSADL